MLEFDPMDSDDSEDEDGAGGEGGGAAAEGADGEASTTTKSTAALLREASKWVICRFLSPFILFFLCVCGFSFIKAA